MSFQVKEWLDRLSEHPSRRQLTSVTDPTDVKSYDITRDEGTVLQAGSPINANAMNDLERRIKEGYDSLVGSAVTVTLLASAWTADNTITVTVQGVALASNQEIFGLPATSAANIANNKALQAANLMDYGQDEDEITLYAENVPSVDLQIRVIVRS